jgi:hypothetical protein
MASNKVDSNENKEPAAVELPAKSRSGSASLMQGLFLIVLGLFFLANNFTNFYLDNWWALFILIPAVNNFSEAVRRLRKDGNLSRKVRGHFFWSIFFVMLSAAFLLNLDFGLFWPAFLIFAGLGVLLGAFKN